MQCIYVVVNLQVEGIHFWPDAAKYSIEVAYLQLPHRHMFHIKAICQVSHSDRDIEIILFKRKIGEYLKNNYWSEGIGACDFGARSCEVLAKELVEEFDLASCEVNEDGENGALVTIPFPKTF